MKIKLVTLVILLILSAASCSDSKYPGPMTTEEAIEAFQLKDGFEIEVFAAEPDVMDPVEMMFDEKGNAYVVEMPDYPFMPEDKKGTGRIRVLQDADHDGRIDGSIIFADSILEATSMLPWKDGLIVTAAPYILYLKDTDGDSRADSTEILFSGFFENNSEAQITSLRFGVDNWIYAANNGQAGEVTFNRKPEAPPLSMRGADFRFRLDRGQFELESGGAQFGQTMDDWGHRFITQNTIHIRNVVIPMRYLKRNPNMPSRPSTINISDHDLEMFQMTPPPYWRAERTRRRQQQYKEQNLDRVEYAEDHFTGSSGGTIYAGDAFPEEYYGNVFTGDVAGNLVHRDILVPLEDSPTFVAKRAESEQNKEFLASTDSWFRPAGFTVGPDGMLYIVDMYRQHIETPLSIPEDLKEDMDFMMGSEYGRIYRVVPENSGARSHGTFSLEDKSTAELVETLTHANRWWRLHAQRLLLEKQDASAIPAATALFKQHDDPRTRLHALYVLEGLNALNAGLVRDAVNDQHPGVREHGIILAERYPELLPDILKMVDDSVARVAFQAALSVGEFNGPKVVDALTKVLEKHGKDSWFRTAVLSSEAGSSMDLVQDLRKTSFFAAPEEWKLDFLEDFSFSVGSAADKKVVLSFLNLFDSPAMKDEQWKVAGVKGLAKGLERSKAAGDGLKEQLKAVKTGNAEETNQSIALLKDLMVKAGKV